MKHQLLIALFSVAASAAHAQNNPPANPYTNNAAAIDEGRGLFNSTCTSCHGPNGAAGELGPGLAIPGRTYARRTDAQIFGAIQHGIAGMPMPAHQGKLTDDQIGKITAYVHGLRGTAIDAPSPGDMAAG